MSEPRVFNSSVFFQSNDGEPIRSVITESVYAAVIAWYVQPGQQISAHIHPNGQDTWTILSGEGEYLCDREGTSQLITKGDIVIAPVGEIHGVRNNGNQPLVFISMVCPGDAGYQLA